MFKGSLGIEKIGISRDFPPNPKYFKEMFLYNTYKIPKKNPNIKNILSVMIEVDIVSHRLIQTPKGLSQEGQYICGNKLLANIRIKEKIKYVSKEEDESICIIYIENDLDSNFIVLPQTIQGISMKELYRKKKVVITPYVEDVHVRMKDEQTIIKVISVFLDITIKKIDDKERRNTLKRRIQTTV